jgi:hypothetical protein
VTKEVFEASAKKHNKEVEEAIRNLPTIKVGTTEIPVFDSGKRMTPEEMARLQSDPAFIDLAHTVHRVTKDAIAKLSTADLPIQLAGLGNKIQKIGMVFSDKLHGVHITNPLNKEETFLFINPFTDLKGSPERAASQVWHTIKHEIIHDKVKGHYETFTSAEAAVAGALGSRSELGGIQELEDVYADPANPGGIRPDLGGALQLYEDSRGRKETAPDIFGGEGLATGVHAGTGPDAADEGRVQPRGDGTLSEHPNPLIQMSKKTGPGTLPEVMAEAQERKPGALRRVDLEEPFRRPIKTFVSPSTTNLENIGQAEEALGMAPQKLMQDASDWLLKELGVEVKSRKALGIWEDGAENTVLHEYPRDTDHDLVTYHNAILAGAGYQKFMLNFFPHPDGDDILFRVKFPKDAGTPADISKVLAEYGIKASTIVSERDGHAVLIATTGEGEQDTELAVHKATAQLGGERGAELVRTSGRSEYVGADDRGGAEDVFTQIIEDKEKLHPEWREARLRLESRPGFVDLRRLTREEPVSLDALKAQALGLEPGIDPNEVILNRKNNLNWDDIKDYLLPEELTHYEQNPELQRKIVASVNMMPNTEEWDAATRAGMIGHLWYERSGRAFDALISAMPDSFKPGDKDRFLNFVSALSPVQTVRLNLMMAIDLWDKWNKAGRPTDVEWKKPKTNEGVKNESSKLYRLMAGLLKEEVPPEEQGLFGGGKRGRKPMRPMRGVDLKSRLFNAIRALQDQPLSGPKVSAFAPNLGKNIHKSTNDTWMAVFSDTDPNTINQKHLYDAVSTHVRIAAKKNGINTRQAQAAIWSFIKALAELSGWGADRWIPPQEIIDRNLLTPELIEAHAQDFADLLLTDYNIRAKLSRIGADLNALDRNIRRKVPAKPAAEPGALEGLAGRLSGSASRLEAARASERIAKHLGRKLDVTQGRQGQLLPMTLHEARTEVARRDPRPERLAASAGESERPFQALRSAEALPPEKIDPKAKQEYLEEFERQRAELLSRIGDPKITDGERMRIAQALERLRWMKNNLEAHNILSADPLENRSAQQRFGLLVER